MSLVHVPVRPSDVLRSHAPWSQSGSRGGGRREDKQFAAMRQAYEGSGGLMSVDDVARLLRRRSELSSSGLARLIAARLVVSFEWQGQCLVPLFQFEPAGMYVREGIDAVIHTLADTLDDWGIAAWFAQPNRWLQDTPPVDRFLSDRRAVLDAALQERAARARRA